MSTTQQYNTVNYDNNDNTWNGGSNNRKITKKKTLTEAVACTWPYRKYLVSLF